MDTPNHEKIHCPYRTSIAAPFAVHLQMGIFECEALRYTFPTLMAPFYSVVFTLLVIAVLNIVGLKKYAGEARTDRWRTHQSLCADVNHIAVHVLRHVPSARLNYRSRLLLRYA